MGHSVERIDGPSIVQLYGFVSLSAGSPVNRVQDKCQGKADRSDSSCAATDAARRTGVKSTDTHDAEVRGRMNRRESQTVDFFELSLGSSVASAQNPISFAHEARLK